MKTIKQLNAIKQLIKLNQSLIDDAKQTVTQCQQRIENYKSELMEKEKTIQVVKTK